MPTRRASLCLSLIGLSVSLFRASPVYADATPTEARAQATKRPSAKVTRQSAVKPTAGRSSKKSTQKRAPKSVARHHRSDAEFPADLEQTPGYRYAQLSRAECGSELKSRALPATLLDETHEGLDAPTRLKGALNDVTIATNFAGENGAPSIYALLDCRLVLALDDFTKYLKELGVNEIQFSSAYRPPPRGSLETAQGKRHSGGLAMDVHRFKSSDLGWVSVEKDFHGRIGAKVCGKAARPPIPATKAATLLHQLACKAHETHLFQSVLTPNYDYPHRNHFHLEVTPGVRWFLIS